MIRNLYVTAAALLLAIISMACSGSGNNPVPRPRAYPRITLYAPEFHVADSLPGGFAIVDGSECSPIRHSADGNSTWADIRYPRYDMTLHLTFTPVDGDERLGAVTDNRLQRMAMNIDDEGAEEITLTTPAGYTALILVAKGGVPTPVQFIASRTDMVVSGAARFDAPEINPDSTQPIVDAVAANIVYAIEHLQ